MGDHVKVRLQATYYKDSADIGWSGFELSADGIWELTTAGFGDPSWATLEIASWLLRTADIQTVAVDGPTPT